MFNIIDLNFDFWLLLRMFIMLFAIINPIGNLPIFIAITKGMNREERKKELDRAIVVASILLLSFAFLGNLVLSALGITLNNFMIAGGILLLLLSFDLLRGEHKYMISAKSGAGAVPIGTPLLAGPGAITTVMAIIQKEGIFVSLFTIFAAIIVTKYLLGQSERIFNVLGDVGSEVLSRVMGILVAAIAIHFIGNGIIGMFFNNI